MARPKFATEADALQYVLSGDYIDDDPDIKPRKGAPMTRDEIIKKLQGVRDHLSVVATKQAKTAKVLLTDDKTVWLECVSILEDHAQVLRNCVYVENLIRDLKEGVKGGGFSGTLDADSYYRQLEKMIREATDESKKREVKYKIIKTITAEEVVTQFHDHLGCIARKRSFVNGRGGWDSEGHAEFMERLKARMPAEEYANLEEEMSVRDWHTHKALEALEAKEKSADES